MSMIELNSATVEQLQALPGIGPVLSNRILKYKNRLGGFSSKGQLKEVFGLSTETFVRIESCVIVDKSLIQELNLNVVKLDQLKKHPYISFRQAMDLMRYRERKGKFQNIEDINKLNLLPDSVYVKVRPYLKI
jgi:DNA uptake protein ComE-like DNA-binding protein